MANSFSRHASPGANSLVASDAVQAATAQAPQLYDCHLDQALLVLVLAMKRARRSPKLRRHRCPTAAITNNRQTPKRTRQCRGMTSVPGRGRRDFEPAT
jgi:hypothetical protein